MKNIVICDIDGTIANLDHRKHFLERKDYKSFYNNVDKDKPILPIIHLVEQFYDYFYDIYFVSGRSDECRIKTQLWLLKNVGVEYKNLFMRPAGNHQPDWIIKQKILKENFNLEEIAYVIDDRNQVVDMWRKHGLTVLQVANGDF